MPGLGFESMSGTMEWQPRELHVGDEREELCRGGAPDEQAQPLLQSGYSGSRSTNE